MAIFKDINRTDVPILLTSVLTVLGKIEFTAGSSRKTIRLLSGELHRDTQAMPQADKYCHKQTSRDERKMGAGKYRQVTED